MPNIGPLELAIVLGIVLIIFGPKRLPGLGRSLGAGMREFKDSITGASRDDADELEPGEQAGGESGDAARRDPDSGQRRDEQRVSGPSS